MSFPRFFRLTAVCCLALAVSTVKAGDDSLRKLNESLSKLTPAAGMELLAKVLKMDEDLQAAAKGDVLVNVVERGVTKPEYLGTLNCQVRASKPKSGFATTILWVVDSGTRVRKGERLIQLDDSFLKNRLDEQYLRSARASVAFQTTKANLTELEAETPIKTRLGKLAIKLAMLELEKLGGKGALDKQILELKVERAKLALSLIQTRANSQKKQLDAALNVNKMANALENEKLDDLKQDITNCRIVAPRDGYVFHYGYANGHARKIAQGEPVVQGQTLLAMPDLTKFFLAVLIRESQIAKVKKGQKALIRLDALPDRAFSGHVKRISGVPETLSPKVKLFRAEITINEDAAKLKLAMGMPGKAAIVVDSRLDVLRLPVSAVFDGLTEKAGKFCCVVSEKEIRLRPVRVGARGMQFVEILEGLKEGERVLANPRAIAQRLHRSSVR